MRSRHGLRWCGLLALGLIGSPEGLSAQEYKYEIGVALGSAYYVGELGDRGAFGRQGASLALTLRHPLGLRWVWASQLGYRRLRGALSPTSRAFPTIGDRAFSRGIIDLSLGGEYHFFAYSDGQRYLGTRSWTPYLGAGLGLVLGRGYPRPLVAPSVYLTLGVKYRLTHRLDLTASWTHHRSGTDRLEVTGAGSAWMANPHGWGDASLKGHDSYGYWSLGISWRVGRTSGEGCY